MLHSGALGKLTYTSLSVRCAWVLTGTSLCIHTSLIQKLMEMNTRVVESDFIPPNFHYSIFKNSKEKNLMK